jgi:hypothetical protein
MQRTEKFSLVLSPGETAALDALVQRHSYTWRRAA